MNMHVLGGLKDSQKLYRIVRVDHLEEMFHTNQNVLVRPKSWDDKFEGQLIGNGIAFNNEANSGAQYYKNIIFAQCWTLEYSSALMWAAYAKNKLEYVRIQTTVGKLKKSLQNAINASWHGFAAYIGKVSYLNYKEIENKINELEKSRPNWRTLAELSLIKSNAFAGENEVRLIQISFDESDDEQSQRKLNKYSCSMFDLIDCIRLSPGFTPKEFASQKKAIEKRTGFKNIKRSTIYDGKKLKQLTFNHDFDPNGF